MSTDSDQVWQEHAPPPVMPRSRIWPWLVAILIVSMGAVGVYAWPVIAPLVPALSHGTDTAAAGDKEVLPDLLAAQQKSEESLAALDQAITEQRNQIKGIVDELAALSAKIDALQRPASMPAPTATEAPRASISPPAPKSKKPPPRAPKPTGPISTGGAPLTAAPGATIR